MKERKSDDAAFRCWLLLRIIKSIRTSQDKFVVACSISNLISLWGAMGHPNGHFKHDNLWDIEWEGEWGCSRENKPRQRAEKAF